MHHQDHLVYVYRLSRNTFKTQTDYIFNSQRSLHTFYPLKSLLLRDIFYVRRNADVFEVIFLDITASEGALKLHAPELSC